MSRYLLTYHGGKKPTSEDEVKRVMGEWHSWFEGLGSSVVDGGNPVGPSQTVESNGSISPDGGANPVSGYSLIEASDMDDALTKAKGCPILKGGGSVEVAETFTI